jgi:transposase
MLWTSEVPVLVVRRIVVEGRVVGLDAEVAGDRARCPACGWESRRCHDRYRRRLQALPWGGCAVRIAVSVRRFVCAHPACSRRTFAEGLGPRIGPRGRRTAEATSELVAVASALGARAGARRATQSGLPVSRDTLRRLLRRAAPEEVTAPRVLGIDDLATRRGRRYATILVDLETHRPIDLLDGREAETVRSWLVAHPGIGVSSD